MRTKYTKAKMEDAIAVSKSIADVCRYFRLRPTGGTYRLMNIRIRQHGLSTAHFTGRGCWKEATMTRASDPRVDIAHNGYVYGCKFHDVPVTVIAPPRVRWWWKPWTWRRKPAKQTATIVGCEFIGPDYDGLIEELTR